MAIRKPYGNPADAIQAGAAPEPAPAPVEGGAPGAAPEGMPEQGTPEEAESNPVIQGLKAIMQFGLALKEKGDPRGAELLSVIQKIPQILSGGGEQAPQEEAAPGAPVPPKAQPMAGGRDMNAAPGSKPMVM